MAADYRRHRCESEGEQSENSEGNGPDGKRGQLFPGARRYASGDRSAGMNHGPVMTAGRPRFAGENPRK